jgi:hypothetical protein
MVVKTVGWSSASFRQLPLLWSSPTLLTPEMGKDLEKVVERCYAPHSPDGKPQPSEHPPSRSKIKDKNKLSIASWYVRTLLHLAGTSDRPDRRTALVALELARYIIDIAALSETRLHGENSLSEGGARYTFFWKGVPEGTRRNHLVGFAMKCKLLQRIPVSPIGINERLIEFLSRKRLVC